MIGCWHRSRAACARQCPGTTSIAHLEENIGALGLALDETVTTRIDAIFGPGAIRGPRYVAAMQAQIDTETLPGEELAD